MNIQTKAIPSPCTGICTMDGALGLCLGCGRTGDEITEWSSANDVRRSAIWAVLPERIDALGISITRMPWPPDRIADFVAESLDQRSGTWALGCYGATAEFLCRHDEPCDVSITHETITAISDRGALQLTIGEHVRALRLRADHPRRGNRAIFLVVLKARATLPVATTLTPLGRDKGAIRRERRNDAWYDLGLGRADLRFCVRASATELRDKLNQASGLPLSDVLQAAGATIMKHSPARVVESPLGRAEIYTRIPPPGGQSPDGPHTHLLSGQLASGRATQPGIDLPPVYALGATFYPRTGSRALPDSCLYASAQPTAIAFEGPRMGEPPANFAILHAAKDARQPALYRAIAIWLWSLAGLVFLMVIVGGATRLTESGLSITEWKPLTGIIPPLSPAKWLAEFENYKKIPQYAQLFPDMDLRGFKFIFFIEWSHRLLGRLIGAAMLLPLIFFWAKGLLPHGFKPKLLGVLGLGALQGFVGWWMVKSGLSDRVEVAQERLAIHLLLASLTFAALIWLAASLKRSVAQIPERRLPGLRWFAGGTVLLVLLQIGLGGLVAGLRAGHAFNTWPLIDGYFWPPLDKLTLLSPLWRNFLDNILLVQFQHRMIAYALLALALAQALYASRAGVGSRAVRRAWAVAGLVAMQAIIGIATLVLVVPLWAGLLHQAFAMIVLGMAVAHAQALSKAR